MEKVKVVIGANFGDEGKGLMTDYFCSEFPESEKVLNVRFNGGAQAGHTVVTPEGKRHVFHHFGSGSFLPNVATWLGPEFIVNPILFRREYEQFYQLTGRHPRIYCHPKCILTMPQDMMINQFIEKRRGDERHGSCGVGIYETLMRTRELQKDISMQNIADHMRNGYHFLLDFDYYGYGRVEKMTGLKLEKDEIALMNNQNIAARFDQDVRFMTNHMIMMDESILELFRYAVFEGAQGLMLDQNNLEYFPHLTPSNTGIENVLPYLENGMDTSICYVTRPYLTRHGAGMLKNECSREEVNAKIDQTNHTNEWQGGFRYGKLNWKELVERVTEDAFKAYPHAEATIAMTHMDEVHDSIPEWDDVYRTVCYYSDGPTRDHVLNNRSELL